MPLFWLCLSFTAGIFVAVRVPASAWIWLAAALILLAVAWIEFHRAHSSSHPLLSHPLFRLPVALLAACFALGGWRMQAAQTSITAHELAAFANGEDRVVTARIISYPEESAESTRAILQAIDIKIGGEKLPISGKLELRLPGGFHLSYGDVLQMEGRLDATLDEGQPAYQSYLARRGILARMSYPQVDTIARDQGSPLMRCIYALRDHALEFIYDHIPFPESALLSGILLGIDWTIPDYLEEAYRACGVLHIIAISGYNIALISGLIVRLTRRFLSPGKAGAAAILTITLYTILVGADPAVVRAAIMGSLSIPAHYFGRKIIPLHSLAVAAALMLAGSPMLLWDIGFQLSFLACLGLTTLVDPIQRVLGDTIEKHVSAAARQWWQPVVILVVSTLAAQFAVFPVILELNPAISFNTLVANLTILPIQPIVMALGGLAVISGLLLPAIGNIFAIAAWPFLVYNNRLAVHFGFQPGAELILPSGLQVPILIADILILALFSVFYLHNLGNKPNSVNDKNDS